MKAHALTRQLKRVSWKASPLPPIRSTPRDDALTELFPSSLVLPSLSAARSTGFFLVVSALPTPTVLRIPLTTLIPVFAAATLSAISLIPVNRALPLILTLLLAALVALGCHKVTCTTPSHVAWQTAKTFQASPALSVDFQRSLLSLDALALRPTPTEPTTTLVPATVDVVRLVLVAPHVSPTVL